MVVPIWECDFHKEMAEDAELQQFAASHKLKEPLNPRDAFFGGRTNASVLHHKASEELGHKIRDFDVNSLYPCKNKTVAYPVGHPIIKPGHLVDLSRLYKTKGLFKGKVLPPRDLLHPILPLRIGGKLMFVLCAKCAEVMAVKAVCQHTPDERALYGTWALLELNEALEHGYRVMSCDQVWDIEDVQKGHFAPYINLFLKIKHQAKGWPDWATTDALKDRYIASIFEKDGVLLDKAKVAKNPALYALAKICLNSFWGKFGQRDNLGTVELVQQLDRYWDLLESGRYEVLGLDFPTSNVAQISFQEARPFVDAGPFGNVVIAAYTTAAARIHLWKDLNALGDRVLYYDTGKWTIST